MQGIDKKIFRWVLGVHGCMVLLLCTYGFLSGCLRTPPDRVMPIEFLVDVRQVAPEQTAAVPASTPAPTPVPTPAPVLTPVPTPAPVSTPRPPREIRVNTNRVVRQASTPTPAPVAAAPNPLTAKQIQDLLDDGATASTRNSIPDADGRGLALIRQTLYAIWEVPARAAVGDAKAILELQLGAGGVVQSARVVAPSGNPVLDESVARVGEKIGRIHGLPVGFEERRPRVTVEFLVE